MSAPTPINVIATKAKFYSLGVCCRLVPLTEIADWLEARLREYDSPPKWLVDVAHSVCRLPFNLTISWELADFARKRGVASLQVADVRRLLGWLVQAIDAKRFTPFDAEIALRWLVEHTPPTEHIIAEILAARTRFRVRRRRHHRLKQGWRELREWCEQARLDPAAN